jgi:hypothetical protein
MSARRVQKQMAAEVAALAGLLGVPAEDIEVRKGASPDLDLLVSVAGHSFVVDVLGGASPGVLAKHTAQLAAAAGRQRRKTIPVVAVPFMNEVGRRVCNEAKVAWFDLSGNARIIAPGLRIVVDGQPNRFRVPGRPASIFAPKSARVVRWLLENEGRALTQREIARATNMTEGFVSRIASRLEEQSYVVREANGALRVKDPRLMLDAWRDEYRFDKHTLIQGHVAARSGDALARLVGQALTTASVEHAATGLAAAWQLTRFAAFRIATFYIAEAPSTQLRESLGLREEARGANLWLAIPNDVGVFQGAELKNGVRCVHPVQAYIDLKAHPERAPEAAERLRSEFLNWKHDG